MALATVLMALVRLVTARPTAVRLALPLNPLLMALDAMPLQGGLPLFYADEPVGAIGVSGAVPAQDDLVAQAGCDALARLSILNPEPRS